MGSSSQKREILVASHAVDLLAIHHANPHRYPFLLESVASDGDNNRFDILFAFPQETLSLNQLGCVTSTIADLSKTHFLTALNQWFQSKHTSNDFPESLPFSGGWFLYLGYELAQEIEPTLNLPVAEGASLPIAYACRMPGAIIIDRSTQKTWCVLEEEYALYWEELFHDALKETPGELIDPKQVVCDVDEEASNVYLESIKKIKKYIVDGDIFQVNLSRLWSITLQEKMTPSALYARLRKSNPAPFSSLCLINDTAIISSSPERLFSVNGNVVNTRPIAGTCPRERDEFGQIDQEADEQLQYELLAHPKERAEHVMLIDLERNDLGRIAQPGSIEVNELMVLETYEHVHHIVSNVRAELKPKVLPGDIIAATFPGGTITGCPKVRCMEIIAELEQAPREAYTGSLGYLNRNGDMDLNILIRTIVKQGDELHIRAGGGIVADSDGDREVLETEAKAKGMLGALK